MPITRTTSNKYNARNKEKVTTITLSKHARVRCQQRGIPRTAVEVLYQFGKRTHSKGAEKYLMDKVARRRAESNLGRHQFIKIEKWLDAYIVVDGGRIITVAWRRK